MKLSKPRLVLKKTFILAEGKLYWNGVFSGVAVAEEYPIPVIISAADAKSVPLLHPKALRI